jgi:anti-sigma factor RsiW
MSPDGYGPHDRDDAAVWVLGAMEPAEAAAYQRHLDSCPTCREEVAAFQAVTEVLPMAAPQYTVPEDLRRRVLRGIGAEVRGRRRGPQRRRGRAALAIRLPKKAPALALGAALLVAAVILATGVTGGASSPRVLQARVLHSPGTAQVQITGGRAELIIRHLPPPPAGDIYEVWLARANGSPRPTTALFSVNASGTADVGVPGELRNVSHILVTEEPAGGSVVPTHRPVIIAPTA